MARLHLRLASAIAEQPELVAHVAEFTAAKPWRLDAGTEQSEAVTAFYAQATADLQVNPLDFEIDRSAYVGRFASSFVLASSEASALGLVDRNAKVTMNMWHTVGILAALAGHANGVNDEENRAWACSLLYKADPILFRSLARSGKVRSVTAKDTFSSESWYRLEAAGLTSGDRLIVSGSDAVFFLANDDDEAPTVLPAADPEIERLLEEEEAIERSILAAAPAPIADDGLSALGIGKLRKVSRGAVSGGYNMPKNDLIVAIRAALTTSEIIARIEAL